MIHHPSPERGAAASPGPINTPEVFVRAIVGGHLGLWVPGSMLCIAPGMGVV